MGQGLGRTRRMATAVLILLVLRRLRRAHGLLGARP